MDIKTYNKLKEIFDECETHDECDRYCSEEKATECEMVRIHLNNLDTIACNISLNSNNPDTPNKAAYIIKNYPIMYDSEIFKGNPDDYLTIMVCPDCGHVSRVCPDAHDDFICNNCGEFLYLARDTVDTSKY